MKLYLAIILIQFVSTFDCFPNLEEINLTKWKNGTNNCFINSDLKIEKVKCQHCKLTKQNGGYQIITQSKQLIKVYIPYNEDYIEVPFLLNCNNDELSPAIEDFEMTSYSNSIVLHLENSTRFIVMYMSRGINFVIKESKPVTEYDIKGLKPNILHQICISRLNGRNETGMYKCKQTMTLNTTMNQKSSNIQIGSHCEDLVEMKYLEAKFIANNLLNIKWHINVADLCEIAELQITLYEKLSQFCYEQIMIRNTQIVKAKVKDNIIQKKVCIKSKNVMLPHIKTGEIQVYWPKSSVDGQLTAVREDGSKIAQFSMGGVDASSDLKQLHNDLYGNKVKCYADCKSNRKYNGIRSLNHFGKVCVPINIGYGHGLGMLSTFIWRGFRRGCLTIHRNWYHHRSYINWEVCEIPKCNQFKPKDYSCVSMVYRRFRSNSLYGKFVWSNSAIGYIILLHSQSGKCLQYILCGPHKNLLNDQVRSFFKACAKGRTSKNVNKFAFYGVKMHTKYTVYIVPIEHVNRVGKVTYYYQKIRPLKKPSRVTGITMRPISATQMKASWKESKLSSKHDYVDNYSIRLTLNDKVIRAGSTEKYLYIFNNLKECTNYCVRVNAINEGGPSEQADRVCSNTLRKSGSLTLKSISNGSGTYRTIAWSYTSEQCPNVYKIVYWVKSVKQECRQEHLTNKTSFQLKGLYINTPYEILVQVDHPFNPKAKVSSNIQSFYTGDKINTDGIGKFYMDFDKLKKYFYFIYKIESKVAGLLFEYDIVFRNPLTDKCFIRYIIKNECFYLPKCAKTPINLTVKMNNASGNGEDCTKTVREILCIKDMIKLAFGDENIRNMSVSLYGRSNYGWNAIYVNSKGIKENSEMHWWKYLLITSTAIIIICVVAGLVIHKLRIRQKITSTYTKMPNELEK